MAAARGSIQSVGPDALVRGVVVDDDARQAGEEVGVAPADLTDPVEGSAVRHDEQVVVAVRGRIGPEGLDTGHERIRVRRRVGADEVDPSAVGLHDQSDGDRGAERVGIGVLVAHGEYPAGPPDPLHDGGRDVRRPA